nr:hypothetical protein [Tanacetum cinerariifolium]
ISTQADGAHISRVPVPLPEDPYEAIRQAYLVEVDTKSEPFEDLVETERPESPHTVASPTSLPDSTQPTCHVEELEDSDTSGARSTSSNSTAPLLLDHPLTYTTPSLVPSLRMTVRVSPVMSLGLSANLPLRKHYRGTSELVEDDEEEDEVMDESLDSDSESEGVEDEGPIAEDEDATAGDVGLTAEDKGLGEGQIPNVFEVGQSSGSVSEPKRPERVSALRQPTLTTWINLKDGRTYIDVPAYPLPVPPVQTPPSPEWSSCSLTVSPTPSIVEMQGGLIRDHTVRLEELSPALFERYDRDIGELFTRSGAVRDEIFSQRYRFRSLEHEHERVVVTFGAICRPVLALESWAGQMDARRAALWHAISDTQMVNQELRLQIAEERRAWLDLAEIVDSMMKGQEPRGDV